VTVNGIAPGSYTVSEDPATGWTTDAPKAADLTLPSHCTNSVTFANSVPPATATATKVTDPAGGEAGWTFTLTRPDSSTLTGVTGSKGVIDWNGADGATTALAQQGHYTITETAKPGFTQVDAVGCSFDVNFPADARHAFSCTITNRQDATLRHLLGCARELRLEVRDREHRRRLVTDQRQLPGSHEHRLRRNGDGRREPW